jgi:uncharacterized membrane protein SpoIIM required for sporulation
MKEITFLKQNAEKWEQCEKLLNEKQHPDPARLTEMFVEVTDDLSYSATNYRGTKTTEYVNSLASRIHHLVYKNKKEAGNRLINFYKRELPSMFALYHKNLFYSFLVTAIAVAIGVLSQVYDDSFVRMILSDYYVDETIQRIKDGNALGIYGEQNQFFMFVYITINNIRVSFIAFILGFLTTFGTAYILIYNGVMLGCFFTLFYQYGVLSQALKVVWIHGAFEISAIVIAGCAGFVLGNSLIFTGTHTRMESLKKGGTAGLKIVVGLIPFFIAAGFLESFVTRYTNMPLWLSLLIICGSMALIIFYFIILPLKLKSSPKPIRI